MASYFGIRSGLAAVAAGSALTIGYQLNKRNVGARLPPTREMKYPPGADFPDLRNHHNIMKNHLTPGCYAKLRDVVSMFFCLKFCVCPSGEVRCQNKEKSVVTATDGIKVIGIRQ